MKVSVSALLLASISLTPSAIGASQPPKAKAAAFWWTYPQPPHLKPSDPLTTSVGLHVPEKPEDFAWKVTGKFNGKQVYPAAVPVYSDASEGRATRLGEIPIGTDIKLESFIRLGRMIYYAIPFNGKTAYVNGLYVEPAGKKAVDQ